MTKLHELLAVGGNVRAQALKCAADLKATFTGKHHLFTSRLSTLTYLDQTKAALTEEKVELTTTVPKELEWIGGFFKTMINVDGQINDANTKARADLKLDDGTVLAKDVPAIMLLELEKRLKLFQDVIAVAPTLDPAKGFAEDKATGKDIFKAREVTTESTVKEQVPLELAKATDKHPAQVQLVSKDIPIGTRLKQEWSSMITTARKAELLDRCETLIRVTKQARSRANDQAVDTENKIGAALIDFILKA